ncbi:hypothetical protein BT96DRAFT_950256 [Gymnopus androsaceus JB14]|uniref:HAT C-terminal dimerisation domain-containing protein n=1 Tax=Gymnopus androsaceus JB14 TaxID=1447944 RepID=A0A6A4GGX9_9AGAR|nr:hypothetical protein BT96DRAFT_950256 [Gymnopus androsaceus JB14]
MPSTPGVAKKTKDRDRVMIVTVLTTMMDPLKTVSQMIQHWINEALQITREAWSCYKPTGNVRTNEPSSPGQLIPLTSRSMNSFAMHIHTQVNMAMPNVSVDELLEWYLKDSVVPTENPVDWWIMNRKVYPNLSKLGIAVHLVMDWLWLDLFTPPELEAMLKDGDDNAQDNEGFVDDDIILA